MVLVSAFLFAVDWISCHLFRDQSTRRQNDESAPLRWTSTASAGMILEIVWVGDSAGALSLGDVRLGGQTIFLHRITSAPPIPWKVFVTGKQWDCGKIQA